MIFRRTFQTSLLVAVVSMAISCTGDSADTGPYSGYTREGLESAGVDSTIRLPKSLPPGLDPAADTDAFEGSYDVGGRTFDGSELPFRLMHVNGQTADGNAGDNSATAVGPLITSYASAVLTDEGEARFEVRQYDADWSGPYRCRRSEDSMKRSFGEIVVLICGAGLSRESAARDYWSTVTFGTPDDAEWLRDG